MDRLAKIDRDDLVRRMHAEFEKTMSEVAAAVNDAPDGQLIDGSEERCRDVLGEFRRIAYQTAVQMRVEATESDPSFSPGGPCSARGVEPDRLDGLRPDAGSSASVRQSGRGQRCSGG